ncbi:MAG: hypothetical protein ACRCUJ_07535 [Phocaeicola sp.]
MNHYTLNGEFLTAKEIREIAEDYIGAAAYHVPLEYVIQELRKHDFNIKVAGTYGQS